MVVQRISELSDPLTRPGASAPHQTHSPEPSHTLSHTHMPIDLHVTPTGKQQRTTLTTLGMRNKARKDGESDRSEKSRGTEMQSEAKGGETRTLERTRKVKTRAIMRIFCSRDVG